MSEKQLDEGGVSVQDPEMAEKQAVDTNSGTVPKNTSTEAVVALRRSGWSLAKIGRHFGITRQSVHGLLKRSGGINPEAVATFREAEPDVLASKRKLLLDSITEADIKATKSVRDRTISYGVLLDKERLLTGASTSNLGINVRWTDLVSQAHKPEEGGWAAERKVLSDQGLDPDHRDLAYQDRQRVAAAKEGPEVLAEFDAYTKDQAAKWKAAGK